MCLRPIRRLLISSWAIKLAAKALPTIGETERIALEAGSVFFEGDFFTGKPDWKKWMDFKVKPLTEEEQAFMSGPVEDLCAMLNDEDIMQRRDLSPQSWAFIKKHKFFGIIIPKEHGGLGFSAGAHAAVVTKIASRSVTAAVTVMVPNSLGPGELLLRYGTPEQQKHYLPRLACGEDIPCFALTEPTAGSDAASGTSFGVVCKGKWEGKSVLGMKLNFNKRYITLAPIASVVGLAFKLQDPDHLLGDKEDLGITCALLPRDTPGLNIGNRHDPMGIPFQNGPLWGEEVFVPLDVIIGGPAQAGNGWRMLMECLAAGRGISLPSLSVGAAQVSTRAATAYAMLREQFNMPIARFEGVRERLARIATLTYAMNATRRLTVGAIDAGEHPAIASAIAKAYLTEGMRLAINDGMDITAGSSICRGPRNIFARPYASIPIGITVEGANILTRSLIVFGQGAIRCHPFLQKEVDAIANRDVKAFDAAFFGHLGHVFKNALRAFFHALTGNIFAAAPRRHHLKQHYAALSRLSAAFAFISDVGLITLGGALKRKEYLSGRYADAFAWLYIASATLKQHHDDGNPAADYPLVHGVMHHARVEIEKALIGILDNLPNRFMAEVAEFLTFPLGTHATEASDRLTDAIVNSVTEETGPRGRLTADIYIPEASQPGLGQLDATYLAHLETIPLRRRVAQAVKERKIAKGSPRELIVNAEKAGILTKAEAKQLDADEVAKVDVIQVDNFEPAVYTKSR